jgi:hypothetical protein
MFTPAETWRTFPKRELRGPGLSSEDPDGVDTRRQEVVLVFPCRSGFKPISVRMNPDPRDVVEIAERRPSY